MEVALTASLLPEIVSSAQRKDEMAREVERSSFLGDEFSVDDLLDFEGLTDIEQEEAEQEEAQAKPEPMEVDNLDSLCSSSPALSLEPAAPSEITLPSDDVAELEWVSQFVDDTFSDFPPPPCPASIPTFNQAAPKTRAHPEPQSQPIPRKKRTATCVLSMEAVVPLKAKRSKRARAAGWLRPIPVPTPSSSSSSSSSSSPSSSSSCAILWESRPPPEAQKPKKKRGRKPKAQALAGAAPGNGEVGVERRCSHCGVQKTPQWRAGPEGAKTLCNACGVRFKSGRLLPEYRPACSPTFLSHAHSNSHRKVLEMRRKKAELGLLPIAPPVHSF